jgi:hypothetical protein
MRSWQSLVSSSSASDDHALATLAATAPELQLCMLDEHLVPSRASPLSWLLVCGVCTCSGLFCGLASSTIVAAPGGVYEVKVGETFPTA